MTTQLHEQERRPAGGQWAASESASTAETMISPNGPTATGETRCRRCHRPLNKPSSCARRLGPKCRNHLPALIASITGFADVVVHLDGDTLHARLGAS